jgi:hypothetical protein
MKNLTFSYYFKLAFNCAVRAYICDEKWNVEEILQSRKLILPESKLDNKFTHRCYFIEQAKGQKQLFQTR